MAILPQKSRVTLSELAHNAALLSKGVDTVLWMLDGGFAHITHEDLPAIEAFLDGRADTLSLRGGLLPAEAVNG